MGRVFLLALVILFLIQVAVAPPVDQKKKDGEDKKQDVDDYGLEYGRYLQQVVQALEEDKEFAKKLENVTSEQIRTGHIAKELEFVKHNVRSKLDELKRIEVDRLRKLIQQQMEQTELGLYRDGDGRLLSPPSDGRRWRTLPNRDDQGGLHRGQGVKVPKHIDIENPHSFEIEDLQKLIKTATKDLEEIDKQRREEFKKYELEKEATYRDSLKNMTADEKKDAEKHHEELIQKHKDHPKIHHPGSKPQLEQVWEEQDHMPKEEFNPRTFFAMHDVNGDGHLDVDEVEALLLPEVRKLYNPNNEEDDPAEMEEEFHRMREHIFNETDANKDAMISLEEFLKMTQQQDFSKDEGWQGLDERQVYSEAELQEFMRQREMQHQGQYFDQRDYYNVGNPPHPGYPPQGQPMYPGQQFQQGHPQPQLHHPPQGYQQQGHPQQFQQGHPQEQFQQGHPQQQFQQGHPQEQFQQGHPQQQFQQGHPQQQSQQGHPQQQLQQGHPQQQFQQGHPQQQFQQGHPQQQFQQGHPQQQFQQGHPQQQYQQGIPPQQYQQGSQQQFQQGHPQQQSQQGHPQQQSQQALPQQQQFQQAVPQQQQQHSQQAVPQQQQGQQTNQPLQGQAQINAGSIPPAQNIASGQQQAVNSINTNQVHVNQVPNEVRGQDTAAQGSPVSSNPKT